MNFLKTRLALLALIGSFLVFVLVISNFFLNKGILINSGKIEDSGVAVLTFHSVLEAPETGNSSVMTVSELERTFRFLKDEYNPITLQKLHAYLDGKKAVPARAVLLTFDDGYADLAEKVLPLTIKYNIPAVSLPVLKWFQPYPRQDQERNKELPYRRHLSRDQVKQLQSSGLWGFGGHGYDAHWYIPTAQQTSAPYLTGRMWVPEAERSETIGEYKARVWADLLLMKSTMQELNISTSDFAYPYGIYSNDLIELLKEAGFEYLFTLQPGLNKAGEDKSILKRFPTPNRAEDIRALLQKAWN